MEIGTVKPVDIDEQMRGSYLDYAMSVIVARALPDVRDGLKPVHRRILYAMYDMGLSYDKPYRKSARIVGEVLGKYHPHGDTAVYDALVRMAQDFSMRYPLVDGQGNFGSVDGDEAAAMRYTEARLTQAAQEMLADIDKETVDLADNFDGSQKEPTVLPALLPNLLLNGASGIAVGMATNIPPHNLSEVCDAMIYVLDHFHEANKITPNDLLKFIKGPDFPTGGIIVGTEGIRSAYTTGKGRVVMRAKAEIQDIGGGRSAIMVTELPYMVNKAALIERIAELARERRIEALSDLRDESDRRGMSIIIELKRGAQPQVVMNQLLKYTSMQFALGVNMLALVEGEPRVLRLKDLLLSYIGHRRVVITKRSKFELARAKERAHILEGLRIALANLDEVIETIKKSRTVDMAKENLTKRFGLSAIQAQAILDMQLKRLAALERQKIDEEYEDTVKRIACLEDILGNPKKVLQLVRVDTEDLKKRYGDGRRTAIVAGAQEEITLEATIPEEDVLVAITQRGYIKRVPARVYKTQGRGGRGVTGMGTREEDAVQHLFSANTRDNILFFTDQGKVYQERAYRLPDASREARGLPLNNIISLAPKESVTAAVAVRSFEGGRYLVMATRGGKVKRISIEEFASVRPSGLVAITLEEGDQLGWVKLTSGKDEVILVTERGRAIRFSEEEVRPMGRNAGGVMGIRLTRGDVVASMEVVDEKGHLLILMGSGFGKRTALKEYPRQSRNGKGVVAGDIGKIEALGGIVAARVVHESDEITVISAEGMVLRLLVKDIPTIGRAARGVRVMTLKEGDRVASLARINNRGEGKSQNR